MELPVVVWTELNHIRAGFLGQIDEIPPSTFSNPPANVVYTSQDHPCCQQYLGIHQQENNGRE